MGGSKKSCSIWHPEQKEKWGHVGRLFITLFIVCSKVVERFGVVEKREVFNRLPTSYEQIFLSRSDVDSINISTETEEEEYFNLTYIDSLRRRRDVGDILKGDVYPRNLLFSRELCSSVPLENRRPGMVCPSFVK